ncbi:MAG: histidinol phosphatase [Clostridia bacterium]|nr:histidinol phosphatase [Clostridia bacterium]
MIDGHVHIERGPYRIEWIKEFVDIAVKRGIKTLHLLELSHRFFEFNELYSEVTKYNDYQKDWYKKKSGNSIEDYKTLIMQAREYEWPIELKFGLEVCYIEGKEKVIEEIRNSFNWDYITGSVHWIDGWGFDHKPEFWEGQNVDAQYKRYYNIMMNLVKSNLFNILAHPDSIKCFGHYYSGDLDSAYKELAQLIKYSGMQVEQSAGLFLNYKHKEMGMNKQLLNMMKEYGVDIITASDAHSPEDVGQFIQEMQHI